MNKFHRFSAQSSQAILQSNSQSSNGSEDSTESDTGGRSAVTTVGAGRLSRNCDCDGAQVLLASGGIAVRGASLAGTGVLGGVGFVGLAGPGVLSACDRGGANVVEAVAESSKVLGDCCRVSLRSDRFT